MKPIKITGHNELADSFLELTTEGRSAYIMIVRRSGPFVSIGMLEGEVTYIKCGQAEGSQVLPILHGIEPGDHFLVYPPRPEFSSPELPDAHQVLAALGEGGGRSLRPPPGRNLGRRLPRRIRVFPGRSYSKRCVRSFANTSGP